MVSLLCEGKFRTRYIFIILTGSVIAATLLMLELTGVNTAWLVQEPMSFPMEAVDRRHDMHEDSKTEYRDGLLLDGEQIIGEDGRSGSVYDILPWPINRYRFLPNFFTRRTAEPADYRSSHVTFLHHNKAGGSTIKTILIDYAKRLGPAERVLVSNGTFCEVQTEVKMHPHQWATLKRIVVGGYAFGVCDLVPASRPCSYFTLFRNPYTRIVSSYFHCQHHDDQLCGGVDSQNVSIEAWAKLQGGYFFQQLLLHPDMCSQDLNEYAFSYKERTAQDIPYIKPESGPLWFLEKSYFEEELSREQRRDLLKYCLDNLEKWFAVVGIIEEYELSLAMFEEVYGIPFFKHKNMKRNSMKSSNSARNTTLIESMITRLKDDEEVQEAISEDWAIYEKMYDIFNRQRAVLESRITK